MYLAAYYTFVLKFITRLVSSGLCGMMSDDTRENKMVVGADFLSCNFFLMVFEMNYVNFKRF